MATLNEILQRVNTYLQDDADIPVTLELSTRINFVNQAVLDAAAVIAFPQFSQTYETYITGATVSLPSNFRELEANPRFVDSNGRWQEYPVILPQERYARDPDEKYAYKIGNPASGYALVFNNFDANTTISMQFQRYPSGMATLTDKCELENDQYVATKAASYVLQVYGDERFPAVESMANIALQNMIARVYKNPGGLTFQTRKIGAAGYRIGR